MTLTEIDLELVEALREDGRASFESLASRVNLSRKVVSAHVQRLFEDGVLRVVATVHPQFDGITAIGHLSVLVSAHHEQIAQEIAGHSEAVFVSVIAGHAGVVAEIRATDLHHLGQVVGRIRGIDGVDAVETVVYTNVLKEPHAPPPPTDEQATHTLDEVDRTLIALLRTNGRTSYAELAGHVGLSSAAARARARNLIDWGFIRIVTLVNPTRLGRDLMTGFAIELDGTAASALHQVAQLESVDFLALTLGAADGIGTIVTTTAEDTIAVLDRISALDGVARLRAWTHLRLVQERYERS